MERAADRNDNVSGASRRGTWGMPIALGVSSAIGLTIALVADGAADILGSIALTVPAAVAAWHTFRPTT